MCFCLDIEHLPAHHAGLAGGLRKARDQGHPDRGVRMGLAIGEDLEGKGQKGIAGEDRRGLVKGLVRRRPPPAQVVIVHGREIVMDERIAVDAFQRRARPQRLLSRDIEQAGRLDQQERPQPLARAQGRVAHGLHDAPGR